MQSTQTAASKLLEELNLTELQGGARESMLKKIEDHFNRVIMVTMLSAISESQFERFKKALASERSEAEIATIAAEVPGLSQAIEERLQLELNILKAVAR